MDSRLPESQFDQDNIGMCLIVILGRCFSGADLLARRVSEQLGYRLVEENAVLERAAAWGVPQEQLRKALRPVPVLRTCFRQKSRVELVMLRAALAEETAASESVYSGCEAFLLPRHTIPVLRIRINIDLASRITGLGQRLRLTDSEARSHIRRADRAYRRWVRSISGSEDDDPALYDLVVNVDDGDLDTACKTIVAFAIRETPHGAGHEYRAAMGDFALAIRIEAMLKALPDAARLNVAVRADRGLVFLAAMHWSPGDRVAIRSIVSEIPGVRRVEVIELRSGTARLPESLQERKAARWRPWAIGATACGLLAARCMLLQDFGANTLEVASVTGVITDTRCAGNHHVPVSSEKGQCVRDCVRLQSNVKYALFDGARVYTLSDQGLGEEFAARTVTIAGRLDPKSNLLEAQSIKPAAGMLKSLHF